MATGSAGSLVVSLGLNAVEFVAGLTKSEYEARKTAQAIKSSFESIQGAVLKLAAVVGVGLGVNAFADMVKSAIEAEAELQRLGARAGLTGSQLSSLIVPARLAHTDLETVAQASAKLSKALLDFGNDGAKSTQVLKSLGLSAKDIPALLAAPQDALLKVAHLLDLLPEGGTKAGAQLLILGRAGGSTAAFMEELAKQTTLVARRTNEEIQAAKELEERFIKLDLATSGLKTTFANALIEPLNVILNALNDVTGGSDGARGALKKLVDDGSIREWALGAAQAVAALADNLALVGLGALVAIRNVDFAIAKSNAPSMKLTGKLGFTDEEAAAAEAEYKKRFDLREQAENAFTKRLVAIITDGEGTIESALLKAAKRQTQVFGENGPANFHQNADRAADAAIAAAKKKADQAAKTQSFLNAGNRGGADDPTKKILDGQIKALEDNIAREKDLLQSREQLIQASFNAGYLSIKDSYDRTQEARDQALKNTQADYEKEIALLQAFILKRTTTEVQRADASNKIADIRAKEVKANADAITQAQLLSIVREQSDRRYAQDLDELNAKMADLAGNTAKAAGIRFDASTSGLRGEAQSRGDTAAIGNLDALREADQIQKKLTKSTSDYQLVLGDIAIAQGYINLAQSSGAISETDALNKTSELNRSKLADLRAQADAYDKLASSPFATEEQIQNAKRMRLEIAQIAAQTDLLADKFNKTFGDAFSSAFSDFISGTKTAKEAFDGFVKSVTKSISDIASQNIATALFGKGGALSGAGDFFSKLFGGPAKAGAGAAVDATGAAVGTAGAAAADASLTALSVASTSADASLATLAVSVAANDAAFVTVAASAAVVDAAMVTLAASAATAAAALITVAGTSAASGAGSLIGNLFQGFGQAAADGTDFARGGLTLVGERGPELVNLKRGSQVINNETLRGMGRPNLSIVVNVPQGTSGPSADQIGIRVGAHVQRALARNG